MPRTGKNNERTEQVPRGRKKLTKIEPLHPQAEHPDKLYNDLAKFPSENPYPVLRIHKDGTVLYANKASEPLLKAKDIAIGKPVPQEWRRLVKEVLVSGCVTREEVKDDGRVFAFQVTPITGSDYVNFYGMDITERKRAEEKLQEEHNLLRTLIDHMPDGVYIKDKEGRILGYNKSLAESWEARGKDNIIGKTDFDLFEPAKAQHYFDEEQKVIQTGQPIIDQESQCTDKSGIANFLLVTKVPLRDSAGNITGIVGIHRDITERKRAEEALRYQNEMQQTILDSIPVMVMLFDRKGHYKLVNRYGQSTLGWSFEEILQHKDIFAEFYPDPKYREYVLDYIKSASGTESWSDFKTRIRDGHVLDTSWINVPLSDGSIIGIGIDITERKKAEEVLRESEDKFKHVFDYSAIGKSITFLSGEIQVNKAFCEMLGYSQAELKVKKWQEITHPDDVEDSRKAIDSILSRQKDSVQLFKRYIHKNGSIVWADVSASLRRDNKGKPLYLMTSVVNITERKQVEHKILEYQNHLKQLATRLTLTEELERRHIASEIHDEIGQTLAMVKIKLDTLRNSPPSEASAAEIKEISSSVEKVIQKIRTLTFELSNPLLYVLGLEAAVAEWLSEQVQEKHGIATEFQDDGKAKPLDDDVKMMLFRNVRELRTNCIKHAKASRVKVNIRRIDDSIEVVVEDNGVGFDPAEVRLMTGKRAKFGLFSIRESLENLGGHFEIESKPGAGCKAIMTAPLKDQSHKKEV
ncbi:MAG: PAS domain S-box protein [Sedimentisphaerales bacterium]